MAKKTKLWLMIATALVLVGCLLFAAVMTCLRWDFTKLSTARYETNTHKIGEPFHSIRIQTDTTDIVFALSEDGSCTVECVEKETARHSVSVENGVLTVKSDNEQSLYDHIYEIGIHIGDPKLIIYLPFTDYTSLCIRENTGDIALLQNLHFENAEIQTSTGSIHVENLSAKTLTLAVSTGDVTAKGITCDGDFTVQVTTGDSFLSDSTCQTLISNGNTGDLSLRHVIATDTISIHRTTGDVSFTQCDAKDIFVDTDTGDITGSLLTDKVFRTQTNTGDTDVPNTTTGGLCEIITSTGDICITIP